MNIVRSGSGYRFDLNGWIYLHIEGDASERGHQHGFLVAEELATIKRTLEFLSEHDTGKNWAFFRNAAERLHAPKISEEIMLEIKGIADGAQEAGKDITWQDVLTWNAWEELTDYWWPSVAHNYAYGAPLPAQNDMCSAFIAHGDATEGGEIVMAHNSFNNFEAGQFSNVILDIAPREGHRMFMQSSPGFIDSFADFFITGAQIMGTETTIGGFGLYDENGVPEYFRIRQAMQYGSSLTDYVKILLDGNNGGYANSWLFGDMSTGTIMRFEIGLKHYGVETNPECGYFIGFNAPLNPQIRNLECSNTGYCDIRRHQGARQVRLAQLMKEHFGTINCEVGMKILADHHDVYLEQLGFPPEEFQNHPSSRTVDGHYEKDERAYMSDPSRPKPFRPRGAVDGKVTSTDLAARFRLLARWGNSAGLPFLKNEHIDKHPQWEYLRPWLVDRPEQPWTPFVAGQASEQAE